MIHRSPSNFVVYFLCFWSMSLIATDIVRKLARKFDFVSRPKEHRWSARVVSLGGGIAIYFTVIVAFVLVGGRQMLALAAPTTLVFILGLIDDLRGVPPSGKLVVQTIAAAAAVSSGCQLVTPWPIASIAISILWIVIITNSVNLIDNMDGFAAGISSIAAFALFLMLPNELLQLRIVSLAISAASFGFLFHNFNPARVFMGDAGSLTLGFLLATLSTKIKIANPEVTNLSWISAVLVLMVPIFDTTLVSISRRNAGRPLMSGGRDHSSHRLVKLGMSEKRATIALYLFGVLGAIAAKLVISGSGPTILLISVVSIVLATLAGMFLLDMAVYVPTSITQPGSSTPTVEFTRHSLPLPILYVVELAVDIGVLTVVWLAAHWLRFQNEHDLSFVLVTTIIPTLPFLIALKLIAFSAFKIYRGLWKNLSSDDVYLIFKASSLGTLLLVAGLALTTRLQDLSRIVIILDWLLTFIGILGARAALSAFRRWSRKLSERPQRIALIGPMSLLSGIQKTLENEKGTEFAGVILNCPPGDIVPDRPLVLGTLAQLEELVIRYRIDSVAVAPEIADDDLSPAILHGITIQKIRFQLV